MEHGERIPSYPPPSERRTRFSFSLRALFVLTTVVAVFAAVGSRWGAAGLFVAVFVVLVGMATMQIERGIATRRFGIAVAGILALVLTIAVSLRFASVAVWDGVKTVPLRLVVLDSISKKPIAGAVVRLRRLSDSSRPQPFAIPQGEHGVQATTGRDGTASLSEDFNTSGREGPFENYGFVIFRYYGEEFLVQVTADQHRSHQVPLVDLVGMKRNIDDPVPPPIRVLLSPAAIAERK